MLCQGRVKGKKRRSHILGHWSVRRAAELKLTESAAICREVVMHEYEGHALTVQGHCYTYS